MKGIGNRGDVCMGAESQVKVCVVTHTIPPYFAGGGLRAYRCAQRLYTRNGLAFLVAVKGDEGGPRIGKSINPRDALPTDKVLLAPRIVWREAEKSRWRVIRGIAFVFNSLRLLAFLGWTLLWRRKYYDLVHCFGASSWFSLYAVLLSRMLKKPSVLEMTLLGDDDPRSLRTGPRTPVVGWLRHWLFSKANAVNAISPGLASAYLDFGEPADKLWIIPCSVDTARFLPPTEDEKQALRERLGLPKEAFIVLFVGIVQRRKGVDLLVRAFARLASLRWEALLLIVGPLDNTTADETKFIAELTDAIRSLRLEDRVHFLGGVGNVEDYMRASDIFVFPTRREGLGTVLLEAMACGLPVVVNRLEGITDSIITDGVNGRLVGPEDASALAEAMIELARDGEMRERLSRAARETVVTRFSTHVVDARYNSMYRELLTRHRRHSP